MVRTSGQMTRVASMQTMRHSLTPGSSPRHSAAIVARRLRNVDPRGMVER